MPHIPAYAKPPDLGAHLFITATAASRTSAGEAVSDSFPAFGETVMAQMPWSGELISAGHSVKFQAATASRSM